MTTDHHNAAAGEGMTAADERLLRDGAMLMDSHYPRADGSRLEANIEDIWALVDQARDREQSLLTGGPWAVTPSESDYCDPPETSWHVTSADGKVVAIAFNRRDAEHIVALRSDLTTARAALDARWREGVEAAAECCDYYEAALAEKGPGAMEGAQKEARHEASVSMAGFLAEQIRALQPPTPSPVAGEDWRQQLREGCERITAEKYDQWMQRALAAEQRATEAERRVTKLREAVHRMMPSLRVAAGTFASLERNIAELEAALKETGDGA